MKKNRLKKAMGQMVLMTAVMIMLPAVLSFTAEYPRPIIEHYLNEDKVYWEICQITVSPIFDEPETSMVEVYFEKPGRLFLSTADRQIFAIEDTIWTYLKKHGQIQKAVGGTVFNPFDFIDTSQTFYQVLESDADYMILSCADRTTEPDSMRIEFNREGVITSIVYLDANENEVILQFLEESFVKAIPGNNFLVKKPEGVEIIDISD
jgi:hypothetical protein